MAAVEVWPDMIQADDRSDQDKQVNGRQLDGHPKEGSSPNNPTPSTPATSNSGSTHQASPLSSHPLCSHLQGLNPEQLKAVRHFRGPILVLAGAGSGKTRVLTRRIANLVIEHGVRPQNILAVTFTNKATREMHERLEGLLGERARELWVATFHSTALRILRRHATILGYQDNFAVYDEDDTRKTLVEVMRELSIDDKKKSAAHFSRAIDSAKNNFKTPELFRKEQLRPDDIEIADVYELYQRRLLAANAMDFGDLLLNVVLLLRKSRETLNLYQRNLHFVLVDEFQDTNLVQYEFLRMLTALHKNLLVVGDDDQSIYAFRGATIQNILEFEKDFPNTEVIRLEQNYRSTGNILALANQVISINKGRKGKNLWTAEDQGEKIALYAGSDEEEEARFIAQEITKRKERGAKLGEFAIFYRTNAQSRAIEEALSRARIPYRIFGGMKFYERREIKDIVAYLRLLINPADNQALLRIINVPTRGIGPTALQKIRTIARQEDKTLLRTCEEMALESGNKSLRAFVELISSLRTKAAQLPLSGLIEAILHDTLYAAKLKESKDPDAESRFENLQELRSIGADMEQEGVAPLEVLRSFLDRVSLTTSDEVVDASGAADIKETVSLMTLHLAKGLEFSVVFLTGFEEGLLPHSRAMLDPFDIEEERRLCYVGITRAMQQLFITRAHDRGMFSAGGGFGFGGGYRQVSRFAHDMPSELLNDLAGGFMRQLAWTDETMEVDDEFREHTAREDGATGLGWRKSRVVEESDDDDRPIASTFRKKAEKQKSFKLSSNWLSAADNLDPKSDEQALARITQGAKVSHDMLGIGKVLSLEGHGPGRYAVVKFDRFESVKKLVLKHSRLKVLD